MWLFLLDTEHGYLVKLTKVCDYAGWVSEGSESEKDGLLERYGWFVTCRLPAWDDRLVAIWRMIGWGVYDAFNSGIIPRMLCISGENNL